MSRENKPTQRKLAAAKPIAENFAEQSRRIFGENVGFEVDMTKKWQVASLLAELEAAGYITVHQPKEDLDAPESADRKPSLDQPVPD